MRTLTHKILTPAAVALCVALSTVTLSTGAVYAADRNAPPPAPVPDAQQQTMAELTQRIFALEHMVEQLTGQLEESKFTADRTAKQVQVLQDDLSLRLARMEQSLGMTGMPPAAAPGAASPGPAPESALPNANPDVASATPSSPPRRSTSFDTAPATTPPVPAGALAPGAPMSAPVSTPPSARPITPPTITQPGPQAAAGNAGVAVPGNGATSNDTTANGGFVIRTDAQGRPLAADPNAMQAPPRPAAPLPTPQQAAPRAAPGPGPVTSSQVASAPAVAVTLPDAPPKQQYDFAFDFLKRQDYPRAESAMRAFLKAHPKDTLASAAQYWLGETYYVRGDFKQAVAEFNAAYTNYPKGTKAPDSLLKLGMSLARADQAQGACIALGLVKKNYTDAPDTVVKSAQSERTRLKCK